MVDLTVALGGDQMNGVPYGPSAAPEGPDDADAFERSAREVGAVADYAHERGITMTFEVLNRYETSLVNTAAQALEFVELSGSDHLRIHLDTFHMAVEEADIAEAIRSAAEAGLPRARPVRPRDAEHRGRRRGRGRATALSTAIGAGGRRGVLPFDTLRPPASDMLAIWRAPFDDGAERAADAMRVIHRGWSGARWGVASSDCPHAAQPALIEIDTTKESP